jgi:hypothetical protein
MSLVEKTRTTVRSLYLSVHGDGLKVEHILAFADELRAENVPIGALVAGSVNHSTLHCTGLSVRIADEEPQQPDATGPGVGETRG